LTESHFEAPLKLKPALIFSAITTEAACKVKGCFDPLKAQLESAESREAVSERATQDKEQITKERLRPLLRHFSRLLSAGMGRGAFKLLQHNRRGVYFAEYGV